MLTRIEKTKINTANSLPYIYPYAECLEGVETHTVKRRGGDKHKLCLVVITLWLTAC